MEATFQTGGFSCDASILREGDTWLVRLYRREEEQYRTPIRDLVIVNSGLGYLHLRPVGGGAVLGGFLDAAVFSREMAEALPNWLEDLIPECRDLYLPYHIDLVSLGDYAEYNGEY